MVDVALSIEFIIEQVLGVSGAKYQGCTHLNTQEQFEKEIVWRDSRLPKPTWQEILAAWELRKSIPEKKSELELLKYKLNEMDVKIKALESK